MRTARIGLVETHHIASARGKDEVASAGSCAYQKFRRGQGFGFRYQAREESVTHSRSVTYSYGSVSVPKNAGMTPPSRPHDMQFARRLISGSIEDRLFCMRTTLDIPEPLIEEARQLLGFKSKTDTIVVALQELIRRKRIEQLKAMMGHVKLEIDLPKSRRRSRS